MLRNWEMVLTRPGRCLLTLTLFLCVAGSGLAADEAGPKRHTVMADGHPIALWEKSAADASQAGQHDPFAPTEPQAKLYRRLATAHKQWVTVPGGDHAAFMETPRAHFIRELVSFLEGVPE
jgi:pimeloyl-ACP methyl ester carboxylesterase